MSRFLDCFRTKITALKGKLRRRAEEEPELNEDAPTKPYQLARTRRAYLEISNPKPKIVYLRPGLVVGRAEHCWLSLPDSGVSRVHAKFIWEEQHWVVSDQGSTNGVFVNGQRVVDAILNNGDQIKIGQTILVYRE